MQVCVCECVRVGVGRSMVKYDVGSYLDELLSGTVIFLARCVLSLFNCLLISFSPAAK